jgi:O-antigen/teichoic acid export membrane protein
MIHEARATVRNAGLLIGQRSLYMAGGFLFAATVPRLMGPDLFGRYALVTSLAIWFVLFSDPGITQVMIRYIPQLKLEEDRKSLERFFGSLLAVNLLSSGLGAASYFLLTRLWFPDLDGLFLLAMSCAVFARSMANPFFSFLLGLNKAARWGMNEIIRRWLSVFLLLPGFTLAGLRGAAAALFLTELGILVTGIWWSRSHLSRSSFRLDLPAIVPYMKFGLIFFMTHLVAATFQRSGEVLVRSVRADYIQVAYYGLAYNVYLALAGAIPQLAMAFVPLMTTLQARGETEALEGWIEQLLKWLTLGGILIVYGTFLVGNDLVPLVLGGAYREVVIHLLPLAVSLLFFALSSVASVLTMVFNRPEMGLGASVLRLAIFWILGVPFIAWWGSVGACLAVLAASAFHGGYFAWCIRKTVFFSLRRWGLVVGVAALFLPMGWLRASWWVNMGLYAVFVAAYGSVLFFLRVIRLSEVALVWQVLRRRRNAPEAGD